MRGHVPEATPMLESDRARKRVKLLDAARKTFVDRGYHDTKVDDIVAAAGVAKGTFYLYFPDKRSVFSTLVYALVDRIAEGILHVDVEAPIEVVVEEEQAELQEEAAGRAEAFGDGLVGEDQLLADRLAHVQGVHLVGEVADRDAQRPVVAETGRVDAHRPARLPVGIERHAALGPDLLEGAVVPVGEDEVLDGVIGHYEVHPTVVIQINRSHREGFGHGQPGGRILDTETASG
jgi:AcrR family transcriptional regulator